jgi:uncharacterized damage-inducible protein DinB
MLLPIAHALIQAQEDVQTAAAGVPSDALWRRPNGAASIGFHLLHLAGATDRLFTYARGEMLNDDQKAFARAEGQEHPDKDAAALLAMVAAQMDRAMAQLRATDPGTLLDERKIGRAGLPATVLGCLFHGADHAARHAGQCVTTIKLLGSDLRV